MFFYKLNIKYTLNQKYLHNVILDLRVINTPTVVPQKGIHRIYWKADIQFHSRNLEVMINE